MNPPTTYEGLARLLYDANSFDDPDANELKFEQPTFQQLRLEFTRKSKKTLTDGGNTLNTRRKRRKKGKPKVDSREENKENVAAAAPKKSDESFLQEWHDDEVEIADYRSSDDSQDEQLAEWYADLKANKARDPNLPSATGDARKVGPVIRHESSKEEKSWLQNDIADTYVLDTMAKYPAGDNPRQIVFDELVDPRRWIERTHLVAEDLLRTQSHRVFTILRQNRPRNLLAHLRLGYCVTHNAGRPACQRPGGGCALQCHLCGVCCHMYSCTCRLVKRFQWCAHIHAAVVCGGNKFKGDQQVYLHISSRYTQLSHLRATCFDMAADVKRTPGNEDAFAVMGCTTDWTPYSVLRSPRPDLCHVCPQYKRCPECGACRHLYLCACAEYMVRKRVCEHCHVVAIFVSESRVSALRRREFRYLSDVSDDTDEEADPKRDVGPLALPSRRVFARHQKSYAIPFRRIRMGCANGQLVYIVGRSDPHRRFVVRAQNRQCACAQESSADCGSCQMCGHHLSCNCGAADADLCKHTHAVRRFVVRSYRPASTTVESALERVVRRTLNDFYAGCDTAEIDCGPLVATEENINAVVESLKRFLGRDVEVEMQRVDELSFASNDSVKSIVYRSEHVLDKVDHAFDPKGVVKIHPEVSCATSNADSSKNDARIAEPVSEKNVNVSAVEEVDIKSAKEIDGRSFSNSDSATSVCPVEPVLVESSVDDPDDNIPAEMERLNPNSDFEEKSGYSLEPVVELSCHEDSPKTGESSMMENDSEFDGQLLPAQKMDFMWVESSVDDADDNIPAEMERLNLNSDSVEKSGYSLESVVELSCLEDSPKAGKSSTMENDSEFDGQLLSAQKTDSIWVESSVDDVDDINIPAETERLNLNSDSVEKSGYSLEPVVELNYNEDSPKAGESSTMENDSEFDGQPLPAQKTDFMWVESSVDDADDINIPAEMERLNLNGDSEEKSGYSLEPVAELSCNEDSPKAGESSTMENDSECDGQLPAQKTDFICTDDSSASVNEPLAKLQFNHEFSESTLEHSVDDEISAAEEIGKTTEANSSTDLDVTGNSQMNQQLKTGDDRVDTGEMVESTVAGRFLSDNSAETGIQVSLFQNDGSSDRGICKECEKTFFPPLDLSSIKTLRSFFDFQFEPVVEIRYKANAETNGEEYPNVLAESRKCVVTLSESKRSSPPSKPIMRGGCFCGGKAVEKDKYCASSETSELGLASENLEMCSFGGSAPNINAALPKDHSDGICEEEDDKNSVSTEIGESSHVVEDVERNLSKDSVIFWEPVYIDDFPRSSGAKEKDEKKVFTEAWVARVVGKDFEKHGAKVNASPNAESVSHNSDHTFDDFDSVKDDESLIAKESSGSSGLGSFKQKSLNLMRKLNPVKYFKDRQKQETSSVGFFGNRNWSRSRRQRELAFIKSISED